MAASGSRSTLSTPPARQLRLLADLAPAAAVLFGLTTLWLLVSTVQNLTQLVTTTGQQPMSWVAVVFIGIGAVATVITGLITYRLAVVVPRTLRSWRQALAERTQVLGQKR